MDQRLDSSDIYDLYDILHKPASGWIPNYHEQLPSNTDVVLQIRARFGESDITTYFEELDSVGTRLHEIVQEYHQNGCSESQLIAWIENAMNEVATQHIGDRNQLSARSSSCENCWRELELCQDAAATSGLAVATSRMLVAMGIVTWTGYTGPPSWGAAGISLFGGIVGGGITYLFNSGSCANAFISCMRFYECPLGGPGEGPDCGLPCIIPR